MSSGIEEDLFAGCLDRYEGSEPPATPVMLPPSSTHELNDVLRSLGAPVPATEEDVFWSTPPRYSQPAPPTLISVAPAWRVWSARLLFASISCAIVALVVFELRSLSERAQATATSPWIAVLSNAP